MMIGDVVMGKNRKEMDNKRLEGEKEGNGKRKESVEGKKEIMKGFGIGRRLILNYGFIMNFFEILNDLEREEREGKD